MCIFRQPKRASVLLTATVTLDRSRGKDGEDEGKQNLVRSGQPTLIDRGHGKSQAPPSCQAKTAESNQVRFKRNCTLETKSWLPWQVWREHGCPWVYRPDSIVSGNRCGRVTRITSLLSIVLTAATGC